MRSISLHTVTDETMEEEKADVASRNASLTSQAIMMGGGFSIIFVVLGYVIYKIRQMSKQTKTTQVSELAEVAPVHIEEGDIIPNDTKHADEEAARSSP